MTQEDSRAILLDFLEQPLSRKRFNKFYEICYKHVIAFLRSLKKRGYTLPVDKVAERDLLGDLTIDVLGSLLRQDGVGPFPLIFHYFATRGFEDFADADLDDLYDSFLTLIFGFVRRELKLIRKSQNPQIENLKKRFYSELQRESYEIFRTSGNEARLVCTAGNRASVDAELTFMPYEKLIELADISYFETGGTPRSEWCRRLFSLIDEQDDFSKVISLAELISAVVAVNANNVEVFAEPALKEVFHDPVSSMTLRNAVDGTIAWLEDEVLPDLVRSGKATESDVPMYVTAVRLYTLDLTYSPGCDSYAEYFRQSFPKVQHDGYRTSHRYVFESVMKRALDKFREMLK